jgi:hypothetical protein
MNKTRTAGKWFAGLGAVSILFVGLAAAPAQARDTGWDPTNLTTSHVQPTDTGWDPTP